MVILGDKWRYLEITEILGKKWRHWERNVDTGREMEILGEKYGDIGREWRYFERNGDIRR